MSKQRYTPAMSFTFASAPLAEIIVEVKWSDPSAFTFPGAPVQMSMVQPSNSVDEFFMRFGGVAYSAGFKQAERLVPPGFPSMVGQVVYRYRPPADFENELARSALWQVGPGVFTANAVPPYKSWTEFSPLVKAGVEALIETRPERERASDFTSVSLRYIDAFTDEFRGELTHAQLIEALGFKVEIPVALQKVLRAGEAPQHVIQFTMPVENNMSMAVSIGRGQFNGTAALIMSTAITTDGAVNPNVDEVMGRLNTARNMIHDSFVELTSGLHSIMKPTETD